MQDYDGPHFDASLIGPDGKLSRLHKGGAQKQANKLAEQSMLQQAEDAKLMREAAAKTADDYRIQAEKDNELLRGQYANLTTQLEKAQNSTPPPTQFIQDDRRKRTNAYGMSTAKAFNPYALGGQPTSLG
jgi:hypothetical protein